MDRHAVPRSVTNFEFKLIGWFTVKEFIYLLIFAGLAVIVFFVIPVPFLNWFMAALTVGFGVAMVFYKYNERPMDVWLRNLFVSLTHASQYFYHKDNPIPAFLKGVYVSTDEEIAKTHIDANQKLTDYMTTTGQQQTGDVQKQEMNTLIHTTPAQQPIPQQQTADGVPVQSPANQAVGQPRQAPELQPSKAQPFLSGIVRNNNEDPLPNIMMYVNSDAGQVVRILKTNHNGIFATFHPLPSGTFILSPKDLGGNYFFDTMNVTIEGPQKEPLQIYSKELL